MTYRKDHMMDDQTKTEQEKMKEFVDELNALYAKHGYQIAGQLVWVSTNHNTYEAAVQLSVVKFEPK